MHLPNGHLLQNGKYKLTQVVGQGGFGITYRGVWFTEVKGPLGTIQTEVPVCIKEYFFKDYGDRDPQTLAVYVHSETGRQLFDKFKEKLLKEARILSEVHHPYIVNVLEVFEEHNTAYIAMEYIDGDSLKHLLEKEGHLSEGLALRYIRQIGEALQFVHEKNILHLDVKPSNILIDRQGRARLIDFGVSKRYDIEQEETSTTLLTLSKGFAAIEQYDNEGLPQFSPRPDIYSLGATLYNLLTGKIPTESILRATRPLKRPRELNPAISEATEAVILKAMQIVPEERYDSVRAMLEALPEPPAEERPAAPLSTPAPASTEEEEETTLVRSGQPAPTPSDNEEEETTIVAAPLQPEAEPQPAHRASASKKRIVLLGMAGVALAGGAFAYWAWHSPTDTLPLTNGEPAVAQQSTEQPAKEQSQAEPTGVDKPATTERPLTAEASKPTPPPMREEKQTAPAPQPTKAERAEAEKKAAETQKAEEKQAEETEERYQSLLQAGKEQMSQAHYADARTALTQAKATKLTEEVVRLLIRCDELEEQQQIAQRKAQYEEKMAFGRYKIVRKKATSRYGAIDEKGQERIPCQYLSVGLAEQGRAFERTDHRFDIYNAEGVLVGEGLSYY